MQLVFLTFFALVFGTLTPLCTNANQRACPTVNIPKYLGGWNEIGRTGIIRNTFERNCDCVTAKYTLNNPSEVGVLNKCVNSTSNTLQSINGTARIVRPGRLKVTFNSRGAFFFQSMMRPNYNIQNVWLDSQGNYRVALVTYGKLLPGAFHFVWVLSRDAQVSDQDLQTYLNFAKLAGYDISSFQRTPCTPVERPINPAYVS